MKRYLCMLAFALLTPSLGLAQASLTGTYKLVSFQLNVDGKPTTGTMGSNPQGYLFITPKYYVHSYTAKERKFGTSVEDKAALWDSLNFYAGTYETAGDKITVTVDVSFNQLWNGTKQTRTVSRDGNRLTLTSAPIPYPRDPSKTVVSRLTWEKVE